MTTFTKDLLLKNQRAIAKDFGGVRNFEKTIDYLKSSRRTGTWNAIYHAYESDGYGARKIKHAEINPINKNTFEIKKKIGSGSKYKTVVRTWTEIVDSLKGI